MSSITLENLEQRLTALEKEVAQLRQDRQPRPPFKDWRQAVGLFPGNDFMKRIDEAGREIREADRQETAS
jgi:hypothetical protein